jgi:hypothetical protein
VEWARHGFLEAAPSGSGGNPQIHDVEPDQVEIKADQTVGGVSVEVVDSTGFGFRTILDWPQALDSALRLAGACMKLRGIVPALVDAMPTLPPRGSPRDGGCAAPSWPSGWGSGQAHRSG